MQRPARTLLLVRGVESGAWGHLQAKHVPGGTGETEHRQLSLLDLWIREHVDEQVTEPTVRRRSLPVVGDSLSRGNSHSATDPADPSEDEEAIFGVGDKGGDQAEDTERHEAGFEDDLGREQVGESSGEEEECREAK